MKTSPSRGLPRIELAALALAIWTALLLGPPEPERNWDWFPYVTLAHQWAGAPFAEARAHALAEIQAELGTEGAELFHSWSEYRRSVARDPEVLEGQLPFYRVKPLYPALSSLGVRLGLTATATAYWISFFSVFGIGLVTLLWIGRHRGVGSGLAWACGVLLLPPLLGLGRLVTPDAIAGLLLITALYLRVERGAAWLPVALVVMALLARLDHLVFAVAWGAVLAWRRPAERRWAYALIGVSVLSVALLTVLADGYGLRLTLQHTLIAPVDPTGPYSEATWGAILYQYIWRSHPAHLYLGGSAMAALVYLGALGLWSKRRSVEPPSSDGRILLTALFLYAAGHWLIFPAHADRILAWSFPVIVVIWAAGPGWERRSEIP